ncbi:DinB family protein [Maribacter algarum]|uniref:DinB family protein n=1 Tax=Maribacter algarum (ex Zhang et al. 2020) TaxID=2578118 RepID=A0A5S3PR14_9FLAO|nr:DinB family protein [Maribacter algarum]TMM57152.1 DinB family protein [Maribacter algarum]
MEYKPEDGFPYYYSLANDASLDALFSASSSTFTLLHSIDEKKGNYRYAPNKWTIKEVIGHITDHEKIKMFRAFRLSRKETVELWGYDQNSLVRNAKFNALSTEQLIADFSNVRKASISFIDTLSDKQLNIKGMARTHEITLEDFLKSIIGHERHHMAILKEKYILEN